MFGKKGEITTTQIVMIVVLVVSFIVILYFFYRLNLGSTNSSEVCHNSVVLAATGKGLTGSDLNCKTDYVCISGGGKCANFNPTTTVKIDPSKKDEIMKALADQMSSCWYEFGEGNLDYGKVGFWSNGGCALCSVVAFDNKILGENYDITYQDFYNYLNNTKKDSSQTYLYYLYGVYDVSQLESNYKVLKDDAGNNILGSGTFTISTGYYNGIFGGAFNKQIAPVSYVPPSQLSSELKCSNFITKA